MTSEQLASAIGALYKLLGRSAGEAQIDFTTRRLAGHTLERILQDLTAAMEIKGAL